MNRPRLKATTEVFTSPGGDICLLRPSADCDLVLQGADERQHAVVTALDGLTPRAALDRRFGAEPVADVLEVLGAEGLLEDAAAYDVLTKGERGRYDRQLRYF